jgi:hypothetical protein
MLPCLPNIGCHSTPALQAFWHYKPQQHSSQQIRSGSRCCRPAAAAAGADKWVFPKPILDEPAYRRELKQLESSA